MDDIAEAINLNLGQNVSDHEAVLIMSGASANIQTPGISYGRRKY